MMHRVYDALEPKTLKQILQLLHSLSKDATAVQRLQARLDCHDEVKEALKGQMDGDQSMNHWTFDMIFAKIDEFDDKKSDSGAHDLYGSFEFSNCNIDDLFDAVLGYLRRVHTTIQYLYCHANLPWQLDLSDWYDQYTTDTGSDLYMWLTDKGPNLDACLDLLPRGFNTADLNKNGGGNPYISLILMYRPLSHFMRGLFLYQPWQPSKAGDMFAFLKGFCTKVTNDEGFRNTFAQKSGIGSTDLLYKVQGIPNVLDGVMYDLTPINQDIYQALSCRNVEPYLQFLKAGIPAFMLELTDLKAAMDKWGKNGTDADIFQSRFYYGFQGGEWHKNKEDKKKAIDALTRDDGSLNKLLEALWDAECSTVSYIKPHTPTVRLQLPSPGLSHKADIQMTRHNAVTPKDDSTCGNMIGGLVGAGAAVAAVGAAGCVAYAGNAFGFGDAVRSALIGAAPDAANLRG